MIQRNGERERNGKCAQIRTHILSLNPMLSLTCALSLFLSLYPRYLASYFGFAWLGLIFVVISVLFLFLFLAMIQIMSVCLLVFLLFSGSIFPLCSRFFSFQKNYLDFSLVANCANINSSYTDAVMLVLLRVLYADTFYNFYAHKFFYIFILSCERVRMFSRK